METGIEGQSLVPEDQLFILAQAGLYLTATRGLQSVEARICHDRLASLCHSLGRPLLLYSALMGQWRYSLVTDKLAATMQIAERINSLAQEQNDAALTIGAYRALAITLYFLGDFESAKQHATRGLQIWRLGDAPPPVEDSMTPTISCLCYLALSEWHLSEIASSQAHIDEAISLAKELNDTHALLQSLYFAGWLAYMERNPAKVERWASDVIELSTRWNFAHWLHGANALRGALPVTQPKAFRGLNRG